MRTKYYCIEPNCGNEVSKKGYLRCKSCNSLYYSGKNHPQFKVGKPKCIDCKKELTHYGDSRCRSCETKRRWKEGIINLRGKNQPLFIDGRTTKQHKCIECNGKICLNNWYYGNKRCHSCNAKYLWETNIFENRNLALDKNGNWQGGISKLPYAFEFTDSLKESIRARDNYECQNCKITEEEHLIVVGRVLAIHHIDYDKMNYEENNLIAVCCQCNSRANFNRTYWQEFYTNKINDLLKEIGGK